MNGTARRVLKAMTAELVHRSGLRRVVAAARRVRSGGRRVAIVSYHRVVEDFTAQHQRSIPGLLISRETFRKHLEQAHDAGYQFATLDEALEVLSGRRRVPRDLFVVTFDDGYRDVVLHAAPVLERMGVPAVVYLPSGLVGTSRRFHHDRLFHLVAVMRGRGARPWYQGLPAAAAVLLEPIFAGARSPSAALDDFIAEYPCDLLGEVIDALARQLGEGKPPEQGEVMGWEEARALARRGFTLGAHTVNHAVLTLEPPQRVDQELAESKAAIERETGSPVRDFAYCNGWYSDTLIAALVRHGFRSAVTTEDLPNVIGGDPFTLKRKVLWENFSLGALGEYSPALTACQLDDVFGFLGMTRPVLGRRPAQR
ncbi:MAG: polysaccharide deacetylase family protein [Myxococcota bacterium]